MAHRLATLGGVSALLLCTTVSAYAATGSPPVTTPDHVALRAGDGMEVDVTANDKDPDGDQLEVCRLGDVPRALSPSFVHDGRLVVATTEAGARDLRADLLRLRRQLLDRRDAHG